MNTSANKTVLYTTIYPSVAPYLKAWCMSVNQQSDKQFDVCIAVDNTDLDKAVKDHLDSSFAVEFIYFNQQTTAAEVRHAAIAQLINKYDNIVFTDSDDTLACERIASAKSLLKQYDAIACAMQLMDETGSDYPWVFNLENTQDLGQQLIEYNFFGLSNTAYRCQLLKKCLPIPHQIRLVDWWLANKAILMGAKLYFDNSVHMNYRQYSANIAPVLPPYTKPNLAHAIEMICQHYHALLNEDVVTQDTNITAKYQAALNKTTQFKQAMDDSSVCEKYLSALNHQKNYYLWWEQICYPQLEKLWNTI